MASAEIPQVAYEKVNEPQHGLWGLFLSLHPPFLLSCHTRMNGSQKKLDLLRISNHSIKCFNKKKHIRSSSRNAIKILHMLIPYQVSD